MFNARDVTERVDLEGQLSEQALRDPLTGLANRALLTDRVAQALERARRAGEQHALLFIDLNDFKTINDSLGHSAGDRVLSAVADRLHATVRAGDTAARFGGDEFAILMESVGQAEDLAGFVERVLDTLRSPVAIDGRELRVDASIGIALSSGAETSPESLIRDADVAMYAAKGRGGGFALFDASMLEDARARLDLEADLRRALEHREFVLHYQPVVEVATGRMVGVEALLRWQHPQRGLLGPAAFLDHAERTGLIVPLGRWVLRQACLQARQWQQGRPGEPPLSMAVNVSVRQVQPSLLNDVSAVLAETGLEPANLVLEITESLLLDNSESTADTLRQLAALGVRLAIDDFGTGHSALGYLQRVPVGVLKIDKSFVDRLADSGDDAIVRTIVDLAARLDLEVIAEGAETVAQVDVLRELGCRYGQGYIWAKPMDAKSIEPFRTQLTHG